jgi:glycosyltransferase involved in cell wall biosynthesis
MSHHSPHSISIIICAYTEKRWNDLQKAVESVSQQTLSPQEIIVVIDHNPVLYERARKTFPSAVVVENDLAAGSSGARNCGAEKSHGDILAFIDDDARADKDWLSCLIKEYDDPRVMGVGGQIIPQWDAGSPPSWFPEEFYWVVGCTYRGSPEGRTSVRNLILCNMSIWRENFNAIGGFRVGMGHLGGAPKGDEETELCIRAQQHFPQSVFIYQPTAVVTHRVPESRTELRYFFWRCYLEGNSKALLSRLVGANAGLSSEWTYTLRTLPVGAAQGIWSAIRYLDVAGLGKSVTIVAGLATTVYGYLVGKISK